MDKRKTKKKLLRVIRIIPIVIIEGYLVFFIIFPAMIIGGPTDLYFIANHDIKIIQ